jgi:hypothetical protein
MSDRLNAAQTKTATLQDGETMEVVVKTRIATDIETLVDDGSGGTPASHTLTEELRPREDDRWMTYNYEQGPSSRRSYSSPAKSGWYKAILENREGSEATFTLRVVAYGGRPFA